MKTYRIYTVNNKAVLILQRFTHTYLVQFVKTGKESSVNKNCIEYFDKQVKINTNQLKLWKTQ